MHSCFAVHVLRCYFKLLLMGQESATSGMSDRSSPRDDLDSLWICEEYGSEGSLAPTPAPSAVTT